MPDPNVSNLLDISGQTVLGATNPLHRPGGLVASQEHSLELAVALAFIGGGVAVIAGAEAVAAAVQELLGSGHVGGVAVPIDPALVAVRHHTPNRDARFQWRAVDGLAALGAGAPDARFPARVGFGGVLGLSAAADERPP